MDERFPRACVQKIVRLKPIPVSPTKLGGLIEHKKEIKCEKLLSAKLFGSPKCVFICGSKNQ